jgi:hypothetical protein
MIGDFFVTLAIWFLVLSIGASAFVLGISILAPLFIENKNIVKPERYIKITEKGHDFDTDY